jgi:predicted HicB family RNase H-like nuclease
MEKNYFVRLTKEQHKALKTLAVQRDTSMKQLIAEQINKLLATQTNGQEKSK